MYRHIAEVIKETENKRFLSKSDVTKYENYPQIFVEKEKVYTKEEFDEAMSGLKTTFINVEKISNTIPETKAGFIDDLVIEGNTEQPIEMIEIVPEMEIGTIDNNTGLPLNNYDNRIRCVDFVSVKYNDIVSVINDVEGQLNYANIIMYDANKNYVSHVGFVDSVQIPYGVSYIKYYHLKTATSLSKVSINRIDLSFNSVGNKMDDDNSNLSFLIRGVNLFNKNSDEIIKGHKLMGNSIQEDEEYNISHYIPVNGGSICISERNAVRVIFYDKNKNIISPTDLKVNQVLDIVPGCRYIRFNYHKAYEDTVQVVSGDKMVEYREYEEQRVSINLPCQLESVEDIYRDKLYRRKDGIWVIEKVVQTFTLNGSSNELYSGGENNISGSSWKECANNDYFAFGINMTTAFPDIVPLSPDIAFAITHLGGVSIRKGVAISDIFRPFNKTGILNPDVYIEGLQPRNDSYNNISFRLKKSRFSEYEDTMVGFTSYTVFREKIKEFFTNNPMTIKVAMYNPQIIELPLSTQILLNTFEGATNIIAEESSQPLISGLVPKSLAGEVYNLQHQLDDMYDTLSKIDTIQTGNSINYKSYEGDIYVKNSSNGIANDVSIKGKTLVNVLGRGFNDTDAYTRMYGEVISDGYIKVTPNGKNDRQFYRKLEETPLKTNTKYTLIVDILECTLTGTDYHVLYPVSNPLNEHINDSAFNETWGIGIKDCIAGSRHAKLISTKSSFENILYGMRSYVRHIEGVTGEISFRLLLIEGDYTQNPPEYFEGIKSAGDLSDSISIISRNESKNLFDINNFEIMNFYENIPFIYSEYDGANAMHCNILGNTIDYTISCLHTPFHWNTGVGGCYKVKKNTKYNISFDYGYCTEDNTLVIKVMGIYSHERGKVLGRDYNSSQFLPRLVSKTSNKREGNSVTINSENYDYILVYIGGSWKDKPKTSLNVKISGILITEESNIRDLTHESMSKKLICRKENGEYFEIDSLRSTGYLSDTIEKHSDGKYYYHKRCDQRVLNGVNDTWRLVIPEYQPKDTRLIAFNCNSMSGKVKDDKNVLPLADRVLSTSFNASFSAEAIKYHAVDKTIRVAVLKSKLESENSTGFTNWIKDNNITIVYELAEEEVYEIINLNVDIYEGETNIYLKAYPFAPELSLNANQYIGDVINDLQSRTNSLENIVKDYISSQNNVLLYSMYTSDRINFKVDIVTMKTRNSVSVDYNVYKLLNDVIDNRKSNISGMEEIIDFYTMIGKINFEMAEFLFNKLYE